jgi:hypothetical protein
MFEPSIKNFCNNFKTIKIISFYFIMDDPINLHTVLKVFFCNFFKISKIIMFSNYFLVIVLYLFGQFQLISCGASKFFFFCKNLLNGRVSFF